MPAPTGPSTLSTSDLLVVWTCHAQVVAALTILRPALEKMRTTSVDDPYVSSLAERMSRETENTADSAERLTRYVSPDVEVLEELTP